MDTEPTPKKWPVAKIILSIYLASCLVTFCQGLFGCEQDVTTSGPYGSFTTTEKPSAELRKKECWDSISCAVIGSIVYFVYKASKKKKK